MGQIEELRAFVQIVEQESIGKAAEQAGIAKSAMSRKLRLLEERMQTTLITRTTRQWSLTEAGRQYYERGLDMLQSFDEFESQVKNDNLALKGEIRLSVPLYFGKVALSGALLAFAKEHPNVRLNVEFTDRLVDVIAEHHDLVVRISDLQDSSLIARRFCATRHVCCASPEYIASNPPINEPHDFQAHRIIQFGSAKRFKWSFPTSRAKEIDVSLTACMNTHDGGFLIDAAENGLGIVRVPDFLAQTSLAEGRLIQLLESYPFKPRGIHFVYPANRHLPKRTRALMDYLHAKMAIAYPDVNTEQ